MTMTLAQKAELESLREQKQGALEFAEQSDPQNISGITSMTDEQNAELESLREVKDQAFSRSPDLPPPTTKEKFLAAGLGGLRGLTFGAFDKGVAVALALDIMKDKKVSWSEAYTQAKSETTQSLDVLEQKAPGYYMGGEIASFLGGPAQAVGKLAKKGLTKGGKKILSKVQSRYGKETVERIGGRGAGRMERLARRTVTGGAVAGTEEAVFQTGREVVGEGGDFERIPEAVLGGGVVSGTLAILGRLGGVAGLNEFAKRHVTKTIKPLKGHLARGFKPQHVIDLGLVGKTNQEGLDILEDNFSRLNTELKSLLKEGDKKLDAIDLIAEIDKRINTSASLSKHFHSARELKNASDFFLETVKTFAPDGIIDLSTAQNIKRELGKMASWRLDTRDKLSNAEQIFAKQLYIEFMEKITTIAPKGKRIREINVELSKMIPVQMALEHRLPTMNRANWVSMTDAITGAAMVGGPGLSAGGCRFVWIAKDFKV